MSVNSFLLNEDKPLNIRQRLKGIFYVHRNRQIIPHHTSTHITRNEPRPGTSACRADHCKDTPIRSGSPAPRNWPNTLARPLVYSSEESCSRRTSGSSFLGGRTLSGASSRTSSSSVPGAVDDERALPGAKTTKAEHCEPKVRYFCPHCPTNFTRKDDWIAHELCYHERLFEYRCLECNDLFFTDYALKNHVRQAQQCGKIPDVRPLARKVESSKRRTAWGCGICSALLLDWESRCEHIAAHCEASLGKANWSHSKVIIALLRQPVFDPVWRSYLIERHGNYPDSTFGVHWRTSTTGRSSNGKLQLQDWLEMGNSHYNVDFIIKLAYDLGRRFVQGHSISGAKSDGSGQTVSVWVRDGFLDRYRSSQPCNRIEEDIILSSRSDVSGDESEDCETSSSSSGSSGYSLSCTDDALHDVLCHVKTSIVDDLMCEFQHILHHTPDYRKHGDHAEESNSYTKPRSAPKDGKSTSTPSRKRQRRPNNKSKFPWDSGEDGEEDPKKTSSPEGVDKNGQSPKFACPYYQRDPRKIVRRACAGPGWPSVHRIKEHLYRDHKLPIRCSRCGTSFDSEQDLQDHYRQPDICHVVVLEPIQGLDKTQETKLRSRKKLATQSESDKWRAMYKILFPKEAEDLIPSPYYDPSQSADHHRRHEATQIEQYMSRELAPLVRRELEHRVEGTCLTIKEQLMDELEPIIQQCQAQLFQSYRQAKDIPNPTVQLEEKSEFFGFRQSQACIEDNHTFEDTAFFDLSPSLPPLSPSFVPANCLDGPMDSFYVDPGTSSISESDHIPPNIQTSSGNVSVDDHYRYDGNRHLFRPHSFGHLNSLNGGSGTGLFNHWHPDPVPFDISGNLAGSFVPTGNDVSDTHHYSVGRTTLQEGSI